MGTYKYQAMSRDGKKVSGVIEAFNELDAASKIKDSYSIVLQLSEVREQGEFSKLLSADIGGNKLNEKAFTLMCSQFAVILKAGIPIVRTVRLIAEKMTDKVLKRILMQVGDDVEAGRSLSVSFAERGKKILPVTFLESIHAGEESGSLDLAFASVGEHFKKQNKMRAKVRGALIYPIFVLIVAIVVVIVLAPGIRILEKVVKSIMKDEPEDEVEADWVLLEDRFIQHPGLAIEQCRIVLNSMAEHAQHNLSDALFLLWHYTDAGFKRVEEEEDLVDHYEDNLGSYIIKITSSELTQKQNEDIYQFLHAITDLERISDHALNIAESAQEIHTKGIQIEEEVKNELKVLESALSEVVRLAVRALRENDHEAAHRVEPLEELIDTLTADMKHRQVDRLQRGVYSRQNSFVFNDLIGDIERVSDHCSNIAVAMIELEHESFDTHQYIESLMSQKDEEFERYFEEYKEKYHFEEATL